MSFRDNLIHLRAANNMTQEQLALLLGVSRQSVTKWETEKSYPEMDKLLKMCRIFDCTLDDLVQGDLTDKDVTAIVTLNPNDRPADVFGYDEHMSLFANKISNGVMAIILGTAIGVIFFSLSSTDGSVPLLPDNLTVMLGVFCECIGLAICLSLIIPAGLAHSHFVRSHPHIEDFYTEEQKAHTRSLFSYELVGGIISIFLGICVIIFFDESRYEDAIGVPLMLAFIAIGVRFIIHGGMTLNKINLDNYNMAASEVLSAHEIKTSDLPEDQKHTLQSARQSSKRIGAVCGTIMIIATIAGLVMLFVPQYQTALFWLAWPIGGLICGIVSILGHGFASSDE